MFIFSFLINGLAVSLAYAVKSLSRSGTVAAFLVGSLFMIIGGFVSWLLLIMLLVSSSFIEKASVLFRLKSPRRLSSPSEEKDGRSALQVLANSLLALSCLLVYWKSQDTLYFHLMVIAIAGSTADTWASEIGILSQEIPRSMISGKKMPPGKSGGVTRLGLIASFLGAAFTISLAVMFTQAVSASDFILLTMLGGFCSIIDSLLGLSIQEVYIDLETNQEYEALPINADSQRYRRIKGLPGIDNSMVNIISDCLIVIISWMIFRLL